MPHRESRPVLLTLAIGKARRFAGTEACRLAPCKDGSNRGSVERVSRLIEVRLASMLAIRGIFGRSLRKGADDQIDRGC